MAVEDINNNPNILPGHKLMLDIQDGQCEADIVMKKFIDFIKNKDPSRFRRTVGILGESIRLYSAWQEQFIKALIRLSSHNIYLINRRVLINNALILICSSIEFGVRYGAIQFIDINLLINIISSSDLLFSIHFTDWRKGTFPFFLENDF